MLSKLEILTSSKKNNIFNNQLISLKFYLCHYKLSQPIPEALRPKTWVCGRSLAVTADANPAEGKAVCLL